MFCGNFILGRLHFGSEIMEKHTFDWFSLLFWFWNSEKHTFEWLFWLFWFCKRKNAAGPKWNFQKTQFCFILLWKINNFINKCIQNQRVPPWTVSWNLLPGYKLKKNTLLLYFTIENQLFYQNMHPNSKGPPLGRFPKIAFQRSKWIIFLINSLRERTSLSLGAPELQMNDFLNRILKETDQSELGSSRAPNEWFS